jgi:uncharacterized protein
MLESGRLDALAKELREDLVRAGLLVPEGEDELKTILHDNVTTAATSRTAYVVVQPSAACQFGCSYCGQTHTSTFLSPQHQQKVIGQVRDLLAAGRYDALQVGWFGAEPTLAMEQIRALTAGFKAAAAEYGCAYGAKLVTNGALLTPERVSELVTVLGVYFIEITIDGSPEYHNRSRPTKAGRPTFDVVFGNAVAAARRDDLKVAISVRCNVSRTNREGVLELLQMLADAGVQERLSVYAAPVRDWGNNAQEEFGSPTEDFAAWEIAFFVRMLQLGFRPKLLPGRKTIPCMVFRPEAMMFDAYGNVFNCTEVSYVEAYEKPGATKPRLRLTVIDERWRNNRYAIGHVDRKGEIPGRREIFGDFYQRVEGEVYPCAACSMLPVCGGMCPKSWFEGTPACPPAKFNIQERLLLWYASKRGAFREDSANST